MPRTDDDIRTCLIQLRCSAKGCFPWRDPETRELYFPEDQGAAPGISPRMRRYFVTGWEFLTALELDAVMHIQIERVLTFAQSVSFADYILPAYEARLQAKACDDKAGVIFRKYEMNGLYGKFGADPANYAEYVIATTDTLAQWKAKGFQEYQDWGEDKWLLARPPTEIELDDINSKWRYYNVATAASITGFVRAYLFRALSQAEGAIYCDTDSIAARRIHRVDYGDGLGKWKDEGNYDRYAIAGKKLYAFHLSGAPEAYDPDQKNPSWKIASKGVNFQGMENGPEIIARLARGETITHLPQVPTYSIVREKPMFIKRGISRTAKDIRHAPHDCIEPL